MWNQIVKAINQGTIQWDNVLTATPLTVHQWRDLVCGKEYILDAVDIGLLDITKFN